MSGVHDMSVKGVLITDTSDGSTGGGIDLGSRKRHCLTSIRL